MSAVNGMYSNLLITTKSPNISVRMNQDLTYFNIMFCYNCGEKNQDVAIFCKTCGSRMVAQNSVSNNKNSYENTRFLGKFISFFSEIASYMMQIIISTIIAIAVLYGLFWAWAKYGSQI